MGPGIEADTKFEFIGSNVDVAPTFLALAGIDASTVDPPMDASAAFAARDSACFVGLLCHSPAVKG